MFDLLCDHFSNEKKPDDAGEFLGELPYHFPYGTKIRCFYARKGSDLEAAKSQFEKLKNNATAASMR